MHFVQFKMTENVTTPKTKGSKLNLKNPKLTSGSNAGHSAMCLARLTAAGELGASPMVMLLK